MGLRQDPELPSPGRSDGEPFPSPRTTTYSPCTASPCRNPDALSGPGTSGCYPTCYPGPLATRVPAVMPSHARAVRSLPRPPDFLLFRQARLYPTGRWKSIVRAEVFLPPWPDVPGRPIAGGQRRLPTPRPNWPTPPRARRPDDPQGRREIFQCTGNGEQFTRTIETRRDPMRQGETAASLGFGAEPARPTARPIGFPTDLREHGGSARPVYGCVR
jgi:hypothetical protein